MEQQNKLKLQQDAKVLLVISGLFTIALGLSNTFVNVYIWRIKQDFVLIGVFNFFIHLLLPLTFILAGYMTKRRNGTEALRIGILFHAIYFVSILLLRARTIDFIIPLGCFLGIAGGFYWLAFQVLSFDLTNDMNRDTFNSMNGIVAAISTMFSPLLAGYIINQMIDLQGYYLVFGISFALFILIILISLKLHTHRFPGKFKLVHVMHQSNTSWNSIIIGTFFFGIRNGILLFIINLLIFIVSDNELSIGTLTLIGSIISALSYELIEKVMKPSRRKLFIILGTTMMFVAIWGMVFQISYFTIFVFIVLSYFFGPFFIVPFTSASFNIIDRSGHDDERIEFLVHKELALNLGRLVGIAIFIIIAQNTKEISSLKGFLLFIGSTQLVIPFLIKGINADHKIL